LDISIKEIMDKATYSGAAWYDPKDKKFYGGHIGEYSGGILTDVATIEAKIVLADLLGFARPAYTLDAACRSVSTPELVLEVDSEIIVKGNRNVQPLQESQITGSSLKRTHFECYLNEAHIVVEDRAAAKASHDLLSLKIADAAKEIAHMRNSDIDSAIEGGVAWTGAHEGEDWSAASNGVSTYNPMDQIGEVITALIDVGYPPEYLVTSYGDWAHFLANTHIAPMVFAGILNIGGKPQVVLPGYPNVSVLLDAAITPGKAIIGCQRGTILAEGPTESVRYRNELKRYTGFIIRQYEQPQVVLPLSQFTLGVGAAPS